MRDLYAIVGIAKLKAAGNIQGVLSHMLRTRPTPNADGRENLVMIQPPPLPEIMEYINSFIPRKNAVLAYDMLLTASPEFFTGKTPEQVKEWANDALAFACAKFGKHNIQGCVLHLDEQETGSPHLQLLVVPEYQNKLNARHYTGGRECMRKLWTEYAAAMKKHGLKRGREFSPARHKQIKEFYSDVRRGAELAAGRTFTPDELPPPSLGDHMNPAEYAAKLVNHIANYYRKENGNLRAALEATRRELEQVTNQTAADRQLYQQIKENPALVKELQKALALEATARATEQDRFNKLVEAVKVFFKNNIAENSIMRKPENLGNLQDFPELQQAIRISLTPDIKPRQGMTRGL